MLTVIPITRTAILTAARRCIGTPFHHQGRQASVGLDCVGLIVVVCREVGYPLEDQDGYGWIPHRGLLERAAEAWFDPIPPMEMRPADLLMFRFRHEPQHVGLWTERGTLIHVYRQAGRCVEHSYDEEWQRRLDSVWRFRGVTDE